MAARAAKKRTVKSAGELARMAAELKQAVSKFQF